MDFAAARESIVSDAIYVGLEELHRIDDRQILRYDLPLPLLMQVRYEGQPLRLWSIGKSYRAGTVDVTPTNE
ncbi:MAG TPA: hypothetical protein VL173_15155 [Vicinamibacterales bacterium]|nr:hypothetical protein [Vicinamibacterales bacterium]